MSGAGIKTHREEWITPTGGDSNKLQGGRVGEALAQIRVHRKEPSYTVGIRQGKVLESSIEVVSRKWEMRI